MSSDVTLLEMRNISKAFPGVQALSDVSLRVKAGSIHALMGENGAGKSTLMKCLFGIYHKDSGDIFINGTPVNFQTPRQALDNGVSMVHQELNQVVGMSIMENIWLGRFPIKNKMIIDKDKMYKNTLSLFEDLDIHLDPKTKISKLSVSECQMIEITKAVSYNAKIIVLDEPTSSLTDVETERLFKILQKLTARGCGVIYISHKMEEILQISDEVSIMRDGHMIDTKPASELTIPAIIRMMVGRELTDRFPRRAEKPSDDVVLSVRNLEGMYQPSCLDVSFDLHKGEILGIAGLIGSRRTETLETIFGIRTLKSGKILLNGKEINNKNPRIAIKNGFALVTEERRKTGIFPDLSVAFNTVVVVQKKLRNRARLLVNKKIEATTGNVINEMNVKTPTQKTKIKSLSGGNQQKIIIGRWIISNPEILMMDEPTRGIDVGAKYEVYQKMNKLAADGCSILFVSSEMPELIGITDRIVVMSKGRVAGIVDSQTTSQEEIMALCAKYV